MTPGTALRLGRVSNLPTVWTNVLAAAVLAGVTLSPGRGAVLCLTFSLFYVGGMFLNDAYDADIDARERPERPIPSGLVTRAEVLVWGFGLLAGGMALVVLQPVLWGGPRAAPVVSGLALAALIVVYDINHKQNPLSPLLMGLCRVGVYTTVALGVSGRLSPMVLLGAAALLAYLIGLTYAARHEASASVPRTWPLLLLFAPFAVGASVLPQNGTGALVYAGFLAWVGRGLSLLRRGRIPAAVASLIAGICLLDAMLIAVTGNIALALVAAAAFPVTLTLQRYVSGT